MASLTMYTNNPGEEIRLYSLGLFSLKKNSTSIPLWDFLECSSGDGVGIIWGFSSEPGLDVLNSDPLSLRGLQATLQLCDVFVLCSHFLLLRCQASQLTGMYKHFSWV